MIGMAAVSGSALRRRVASQPSITGRLMSIRISAGRSSRARARPSARPPPRPPRSRDVRAGARACPGFISLSSMIRIFCTSFPPLMDLSALPFDRKVGPHQGAYLSEQVFPGAASFSRMRSRLRPSVSRSSGLRSFAVTTTTGIVSPPASCRSSSRNSKPSITGIIRSSRTRLGRSAARTGEPDAAVLRLDDAAAERFRCVAKQGARERVVLDDQHGPGRVQRHITPHDRGEAFAVHGFVRYSLAPRA